MTWNIYLEVSVLYNDYTNYYCYYIGLEKTTFSLVDGGLMIYLA